MTDLETEAGPGQPAVLASGIAWMTIIAWIVGLLSTVYLLGNALLLSFLSVAFMDYSTPDFSWSKVADVGRDSLPLCVFAIIGFLGLKLWPRGRFKLLGLAAIVTQAAMAIWVYVDPLSPVLFPFSGHL